MRDLRELNHLRDRRHEALAYGVNPLDHRHEAEAGSFRVPLKSSKRPLLVIASAGTIEGADGWDHVSVSLPGRCPTWDEMDQVKRLFFLPAEVAFQLHVGEADHISNHRYCLHIWRNINQPVPLPPSIFVGHAALGDLGKPKAA